jgi:hypothetical protein
MIIKLDSFKAIFAIHQLPPRQMIISQANLAFILSLLVLPSFGMQRPTADLGLNAPTVSKANPLPCIIVGHTSRCNPDACHQAGGRCIPNAKKTMCIPASLGTIVKSWVSHPETAQACKYCSCVEQSSEATLIPGNEKGSQRETKTREAASAAAKTSAAEEQPQASITCYMLAKKLGEHCKDVECQKEGGRCLPMADRRTGGYACYPHILENGKLYAVRFERNKDLLPSCTGCKCKNKDNSPPKNQTCGLVDKPGYLCKRADCEREGGRCLSQQYGSHAYCYGHIWRDGKLSRHKFSKGSSLLPSCINCLCVDLGSSPDQPAEKLAGKKKSSEELPTSSDQFQPSLANSLSSTKDFLSPPHHASEKLAGKRKLSEDLPTSSDEFLPSLNQLVSTPEEMSRSPEELQPLWSAEISLSSADLDDILGSRAKKGS